MLTHINRSGLASGNASDIRISDIRVSDIRVSDIRVTVLEVDSPKLRRDVPRRSLPGRAVAALREEYVLEGPGHVGRTEMPRAQGLPVPSHHGERSERPQPSVLVVDDDRDECYNMSDILSDQGYDVAMAHLGQAALQLMKRRPYDVALLDLRLPDMDGLALCRELTQLRPATVAFLITGYPLEVLPNEARAARIRSIFPKPLDVPSLLTHMEDALAGY